MLTSTKPRSPTPRATRAPQPPPISYPFTTAPRPSSQATVVAAPVSPPVTPPRGRRPSISNTMHWLSRSSTQSSSPYAPSKPTRISEPKLVRSIELLSNSRSGVLGSGATIVRTPGEALRETGVRLTFDGKPTEGRAPSPEAVKSRSSAASSKAQLAGPPPSESPSVSPPLPPLPLPEEEEAEFLRESEAPRQPPRPTRAPPTPPSPSLRSSLKSTVPAAEDAIQVPPLPTNICASPRPPPFKPILVSEVPTGAVDPSKIIVTLETCTATFRTTLETLKSRPSHLSNYLSFLLPSPRASIASSVYSTASDDMSSYRHHLTSQGLLPHASFSIHIFLDRPSAPYAHILSYLRSPVATPDAPETLPRSVLMQSSSNLRLESLLELRDEAAYLNLEGLHKLCTDEIRQRHGPRLHTRGRRTSTVGSTHSMHASVYSLHALLECVESDIRSYPRDLGSSGSFHNEAGSTELTTSRSPPTPESWNGPSHEGTIARSSPVRAPPPGWI
ncbi:hypothetical protein LshimejAT787_0107640 [Lyophyllum shimeji]|uniref:Uncharacterized protein n=1 Tax=Lyophyllum shimeji TaxID=47721 RepID=A0A9P3UJY2_LYOSH|nr:hypothetical protein LshimejAT787_0107640 [Lyophyllum shimeji]